MYSVATRDSDDRRMVKGCRQMVCSGLIVWRETASAAVSSCSCVCCCSRSRPVRQPELIQWKDRCPECPQRPDEGIRRRCQQPGKRWSLCHRNGGDQHVGRIKNKIQLFWWKSKHQADRECRGLFESTSACVCPVTSNIVPRSSTRLINCPAVSEWLDGAADERCVEW